MTDNDRIETDFDTAWGNTQKRIMRQERRASVTHAAQILGPGAGPFAVMLNDWAAEEATFTGVFYSEPGAMNAPDREGDPAGSPSAMYWMGETFGVQDEDGVRHGFQRLTRYRVEPDAAGDWDEYRRRFYPDGDLFAYTAWESV